jgi:hypothetical protein
MTNDQKKQVERDALKNGYSWNSDGSKLVNGSSTIKPSGTGNSYSVNGNGPYNSADGVRNIKGYKGK